MRCGGRSCSWPPSGLALTARRRTQLPDLVLLSSLPAMRDAALQGSYIGHQPITTQMV
uniref:Uncharacterized protein n=1 Tax=Arundo donax TaxID=35708 RepID=A0A0A8ZHM5_ARUDO